MGNGVALWCRARGPQARHPRRLLACQPGRRPPDVRARNDLGGPMTVLARPAVETLAILRQVGVIPVVRSDSAEVAIRVTEVLIEAGLPIAEITLTVPNAIDVITKLAQRTGAERILIGAGTVIDADGARRAIRAGAEFIVSPGVVPDVIEAAKAAGVPVISGALTPTEILAATRAGADLIKVFPIKSLGGAAYIRALRAPFPDLPL